MEGMNMQNYEVIPAFEMLLEELDAIVTLHNQQGAELMQAKDYSKAREVIAKAEAVLAFQAEVKTLREKWVQLSVPPTPKAPKKKKPVKRTVTKLLKQGLRTPNQAFHMPILQALVQLGDSGRVGEVLDRVEGMMKNQLNKYDYQTILRILMSFVGVITPNGQG
jgi:hypothetical protein